MATEEEVHAALVMLREHYKQPVLPINEYCSALDTWLACIQALNAEGPQAGQGASHYELQGESYYEVLDEIRIDIAKSNLLGRLLYGGENLRTMPCPQHKGHWSGYQEDCPLGCGMTGWLPNTPQQPPI
jgi:hypothetical protein